MINSVASPPTDPSPPPRRLRSWSWPGLAALLGAVWALGTILIFLAQARGPVAPPRNRPVEADVAPDIVSSETCRSCHPGNYASWHASFHRTMTQVAVDPNFAPEMRDLKLTLARLDYWVERHDEHYQVRTKPTGAPDSAYGQPQQIVLLTGSHTIQVFWLETGDGRTLGQFPFAYLIAEKRWAPVKDTFLTPPGPKDIYGKGDWNSTCINCHVTQPLARPVSGSTTGTYDTLVAEFGISCEACHSGGREHVRINQSPLRRFTLHLTGRNDPTIVNPARLDGPASSLVCGQCHSIWAFKSADDFAAFAKQGGNYRPGGHDLDLRWVAQAQGTDHPEERAALAKNDPHFFDEIFWPDGQIRVIGREYNGVLSSPCYKGGKYSCLSCHELHPAKTDPATLQDWRASGQLKPATEINQSCLQCHAGMKSRLAAHTHHAPDTPGSNCLNCHLPRTIYGLLKATRSHQISSPTARETAEFGRPNACNLCHLDQPLAWTAAKLEEWYGQKPPTLTDDDRELAIGARWILQGDARQRALIALNMGWGPAQQASGREWLYPYLIFELNDPYSAVRFGAWKSLQTLPGFNDFKFDYTMNDAQQKDALDAAYRKWWFEWRSPSGNYRAQTLLQPTGMFRQEIFDRLLDSRDNKKITVVE
jgi:hypothetical protein